MIQETTRRDLLKIAGTASAMSGLALTSTAAEGDRVRVIEAGLRFEVPDNDDYDLVLPDSRPPYTIDQNERKLVILNTASPADASQIQETRDLLDERSAGAADEVTVGPRDGQLKALPTELSSRMRAKEAVHLDSPMQAPTVTLRASGNVPTLNVESEDTVELEVGDRTKIHLDPVTAEARTSHVVGEASIEGVPEYMQGLKRERDSVEIEATPIVEAVNHGELVVDEQSPPRK